LHGGAKHGARCPFQHAPGLLGVEARDILQHRHWIRTDNQRQRQTKAFVRFGRQGEIVLSIQSMPLPLRTGVSGSRSQVSW
jgi:hypothetical protein